MNLFSLLLQLIMSIISTEIRTEIEATKDRPQRASRGFDENIDSQILLVQRLN